MNVVSGINPWIWDMSQSTVYRYTSSGEVDIFAEKSHDIRIFSFLAHRSHKDSSYKFY